MSFTRTRRDRGQPALPLAGFVDMLFLLLVFFMTASGLREAEMQLPVSVPEATSPDQPANPATQTVITIDAENNVYLGGQPIALENLEETLRVLVAEFPQEAVLIRGDTNARYGLGVEVWDLAQRAGVQDVSAATIKPFQE